MTFVSYFSTTLVMVVPVKCETSYLVGVAVNGILKAVAIILLSAFHWFDDEHKLGPVTCRKFCSMLQKGNVFPQISD